MKPSDASPPRKSKQSSGDGSPQVISLRHHQRNLTRERLVASAIELFVSNSYQATTVSEIAQRAGTTPATFYRYFKGKADVARALQEHINVDVKQTLEQFDRMGPPTYDAVRKWIDQYGEMWERMHVMCDAYWDATQTDPELAAELVPTTYRLAESMQVARAIGNAERRSKFVRRFVLHFLLLDKLFHLVELQDRDAAAVKMLDDFAELFRESLFGSSP